MFTVNYQDRLISFENLAEVENWIVATMDAVRPAGFSAWKPDFGRGMDLAIMSDCGQAAQSRAISLSQHGRLLSVEGPDGGKSFFGGLDHRVTIRYLLETWQLDDVCAENAPVIFENGRLMEMPQGDIEVDFLISA